MVPTISRLQIDIAGILNAVTIPALFGLIAASSTLVVIVARSQLQPMYGWLVSAHPHTRRLQRARDAVANERRLRLRDDREILDTFHEVAAEEYENIPDHKAPVELKWMYQAFKIRFGDYNEHGRQNSPGINQEMVGHFDRRISRVFEKIAAVGTVVAIAGFALATLAIIV